jgi:dihydrofolate reductase
MGRLIATEWMTLDGVMQSPSYPDEDASGGFTHGGWHRQYLDEASLGRLVRTVNEASAYLFGRGTYERFAAHWPNASAEEQMLAEPLNTRAKHVASTTLASPLEWRNASLLPGDVAEAVALLKAADDGDLLLIGSPVLLQTLLRHDLVDELQVMIDPIVVGGGKRLFADDGRLAQFRLAECEPVSTGAIMATYALK